MKNKYTDKNAPPVITVPAGSVVLSPCSLVEFGIEGVEILAVKLIGDYAESLAEIYKLKQHTIPSSEALSYQEIQEFSQSALQ